MCQCFFNFKLASATLLKLPDGIIIGQWVKQVESKDHRRSVFSMLAPLISLNDATPPKQGKVTKHWPYRKTSYPVLAQA